MMCFSFSIFCVAHLRKFHGVRLPHTGGRRRSRSPDEEIDAEELARALKRTKLTDESPPESPGPAVSEFSASNSFSSKRPRGRMPPEWDTTNRVTSGRFCTEETSPIAQPSDGPRDEIYLEELDLTQPSFASSEEGSPSSKRMPNVEVHVESDLASVSELAHPDVASLFTGDGSRRSSLSQSQPGNVRTTNPSTESNK